jgi:hypothetical protein
MRSYREADSKYYHSLPPKDENASSGQS